MKYLALAGALACALPTSGCLVEALQTSSITPQQVIVAANGFDALQATAATYLKLPPCPTNAPVCRNAAAVAAIVPAMRSGRIARNQLEAAIGGTSGAPINASLFSVLTGSIKTIQAAFAQYGISA